MRNFIQFEYLSRLMGKPTICIGENKDTDQRLCFRYTNSTIPLLSKSKISLLQPSSVLVQLGLCRTCSKTTLLVFPIHVISPSPRICRSPLFELFAVVFFYPTVQFLTYRMVYTVADLKTHYRITCGYFRMCHKCE